MRPLTASMRHALLFAATFTLSQGGALAGPADAGEHGPSGEAASHLEFESVADGRCQILSAGGKLRLVHNRHAERGIDFRLLRMFAGNHPQGLVVGQLPAGAEPMKLGCTRVDGRPQDWVIQRARYMPQEQE